MIELENWLPAVGLEGRYEVSDIGRVRRVATGRVRKAPIASNGYREVGMRVSGVNRTKRVHVLVAEAFLGPRPAGHDVCHTDTDKLNNCVENLRYDTRSGNKLDEVRVGTHHETRKTRCPFGHRLIAPNLTAVGIRRGRRKCLACDRGRSAVVRARARGVSLDLQHVSDEKYAIIMS